MSTRFAYFPGCSQHGTGREFDESIRAVAGVLDIQLDEIPQWACCGATPAHAIAPGTADALGLWNLAQAGTCGGAPVMTGCASCFSRLRAARAHAAADPAAARQAGVTTDPTILHIAQALGDPAMRSRITAAIRQPLGGLPVACYYGCLLTRPGGPDAIDDAEDPHLLEELAVLVGAKPIDFPLRLDCCGASMALARPDIVHRRSGQLLAMAHARGAKAIVVACPLCHSNLDFQQKPAIASQGGDFIMPVLYLTQLIGLALGIAPQRLGLQRHFVAVPGDLVGAKP
jgi:heterodisulfide reductase subunit B